MLFWKNRTTRTIRLELTMTNSTQADADAIAAQLAAALPLLQAKINAGVDLTATKANADAITALTLPEVTPVA